MKHTLRPIMVSVIFFVAVTFSAAQTPTMAVPAAQYYQGGQAAMYKFIDANKVYPISAKRSKIQGECIIHVDIAADGKILSPSIVMNKGGGTGEEALRVVKLLKFNSPGYKVSTNIPVMFKL